MNIASGMNIYVWVYRKKKKNFNVNMQTTDKQVNKYNYEHFWTNNLSCNVGAFGKYFLDVQKKILFYLNLTSTDSPNKNIL